MSSDENQDFTIEGISSSNATIYFIFVSSFPVTVPCQSRPNLLTETRAPTRWSLWRRVKVRFGGGELLPLPLPLLVLTAGLRSFVLLWLSNCGVFFSLFEVRIDAGGSSHREFFLFVNFISSCGPSPSCRWPDKNSFLFG